MNDEGIKRWRVGSAFAPVKSHLATVVGFGRGGEVAERRDYTGELFVVPANPGLQFIEFGGKRFLRAEPLAQADEGADNMDTHLDGRIAIEHIGRLDGTMLGERMGQVLDVPAPR